MTLKIAVAAIAAVLTLPATASAGPVLLDLFLYAHARVDWPGGFPDFRIEIDHKHLCCTAIAGMRFTDLTGDRRATVGALQDRSGLSALSISGLVPDREYFFLPTASEAKVLYEVIIRNDGDTPLPMVLTFNIFPGELSFDDPQLSGLTTAQDVSVLFRVASARSIFVDYAYEQWRWGVTASETGGIASQSSSLIDPQGLGAPVTTFTPSIPGRTVLHWDGFTGTMAFADLAPSDVFSFAYEITLAGVDHNGRRGTSYRGTAGDPFALESGDPSGSGSLFVFTAGDEVIVPPFPRVPEPNTLVLFGIAGIGMAAHANRARLRRLEA